MNSKPSDSIELVITAPEPHGTLFAYQTRCRTTLGVLCQLLAQAYHRVVIVVPFIQAHLGLADGVLGEALQSALRRGVIVDVVSTGKSLHILEQSSLPHGPSGNLRFFRPSTNITDDQRLGSHAKFCIADGQSAYVGSANLTGPGLSGQLELGLLVHGEIARQIEDFWTYLIEVGIFVPVI